MTEMRFWDDKYSKWWSVTGLCGISFLTNAGFLRGQVPSSDARAVSLGMSVVAGGETFTGGRNPAATASVRRPTFAAGHVRPFGVSELAANATETAFPIGRLGLRVAFAEFGYEAFSTRNLVLAGGWTMGDLAVGVEVGVLATSISGYDGEAGILLRSGWQFDVTDRVGLGATVGVLDQRTAVEVGVRGRPGAGSTLFLSIAATKGYRPDLRMGVEITPMAVLALRIGIQSQPTMTCGGFGIRLPRLAVDLGGSVHPRLGFSTVVTVGLWL